MPNGRRMPRTMRSNVDMVHLFPTDYASLGTKISSVHDLEKPTSPKHFPFPNTPFDNDILFELLMFLFTIVGTGLQFLHLYQSVWWLPHSYSNQAMNFYLMDPNVMVFIGIILSRRIIHMIGRKIIDRYFAKRMHMILHCCNSYFLLGIIFAMLGTCLYKVVQTHPAMNMFYLCYPAALYLILFGFRVDVFYNCIICNENNVMPLHACSSNPSEIRLEVEELKMNFNSRVKQILFNSVLNAYYAGFIPCCFAQNFLHYDVYWATQHVIFLFLSCFTSYAIYMLPIRYCDTLHRSALHLGTWDKVEIRSLLPAAYIWQEDVLWPLGTLVKLGKDLYRAQGDFNVAEPGNSSYSKFYYIFKNPAVGLSGLLAVQIFMVLFQLALLIRCVIWYDTISLSLLLFFNYYTLFKIGRCYLVSSKIYKTEQLMHDKINMRYI